MVARSAGACRTRDRCVRFAHQTALEAAAINAAVQPYSVAWKNARLPLLGGGAIERSLEVPGTIRAAIAERVAAGETWYSADQAFNAGVTATTSVSRLTSSFAEFEDVTVVSGMTSTSVHQSFVEDAGPWGGIVFPIPSYPISFG